MARTAAQKKAHAAGQKLIAKARKHIASGGSKTSWSKPSKNKSRGSRNNSNKQIERIITNPVVSIASKPIPSLIKKYQLDLLLILKSLFKRNLNKRMEVNIETVPRSVFSRGVRGPDKLRPMEDDIFYVGNVYYEGGGGGHKRKPLTPITPIVPVNPVNPVIPWVKNRIPTSTGKEGSSGKGVMSKANRITLYADINKGMVRGNKLTRKIDGYYIIIIKNKKKVRIRSPLLTLNDAIDLLAYRLDNNLIRIGEVVRAGKTNVIGRIPTSMKGYFVKNKRKFKLLLFRGGVNKMLIEKKQFCNDKPGERKKVVKRKVVKRKVKRKVVKKKPKKRVKKKVIKRKKPAKRKRKR